MINILLADDHQILIDGIRSFLEKYDDIQVVAEANNGQEVLDILKAQSTNIDIAVLDIEMPILDGIETCKDIRRNYPQIKVLIISMYNKQDFVLKLIQNGAAGYILKERTKEDLVTAIKNVNAGNTHYGLKVMENAVKTPQKEKEIVQLSEREIEVLQLVAEAYSSKEISALLNISETTVNTHRRNMMGKLEINNVVDLTRYAIKHGYSKIE